MEGSGRTDAHVLGQAGPLPLAERLPAATHQLADAGQRGDEHRDEHLLHPLLERPRLPPHRLAGAAHDGGAGRGRGALSASGGVRFSQRQPSRRAPADDWG